MIIRINFIQNPSPLFELRRVLLCLEEFFVLPEILHFFLFNPFLGPLGIWGEDGFAEYIVSRGA